MNALPPIGMSSASPATPAPTAVPQAPPAPVPDAVTLGSTPPPGVDLATAARILNHKPQGTVETDWVVPGTSLGSPVRGPQGEIFLARFSADEVVSINPLNGSEVWSHHVGGRRCLPPLLCPDGSLVVASDSGNLEVLDPSNGQVQWRQSIPEGAGWPFLGRDGKVYLRGDNMLLGLDLQERKLVSKTPLKQEFEASPVVGKDGTIYGGGHDGDLYALEPNTGKVKWQSPSGGMLRNSPAIGPDGTVYAGCIGNALVAFDPVDGHEKWRFPTPHWLIPDPVVMDDGTVLAGCSDNNLYAIDGATGQKKWAFAMDGEVRTEPTPCQDGLVYAVSDRNTLYGHRCQLRTGGVVGQGP